MKLLKTESKLPFIQLEKGKLYFVKLTSNKIGYKHLRFTDSTITELSTSASVARKKSKRKAKTVIIDEHYNVVMDMELIRDRTSTRPEGSAPPNGTIPLKITKELRNIIGKYVDEDGIFPYNKINLLKNKLFRDEVKKNPKPIEEKEIHHEKPIKETNTFSDSTSADRKRKKKKRVMKKKSRRKMKKKKRKKK